MNISNDEYKRYANGTAKKSPCAKNCVHAFYQAGLYVFWPRDSQRFTARSARMRKIPS